MPGGEAQLAVTAQELERKTVRRLERVGRRALEGIGEQGEVEVTVLVEVGRDGGVPLPHRAHRAHEGELALVVAIDLCGPGVVGDEQVCVAVVVEVGRGDGRGPHARVAGADHLRGEVQAGLLSEEHHVGAVGREHVEPPITIDVAHRQAPEQQVPRALGGKLQPRLAGHFGEARATASHLVSPRVGEAGDGPAARAQGERRVGLAALSHPLAFPGEAVELPENPRCLLLRGA